VSYYDSTGALKDMVQNHLLQLLSLVTMEPPLTLHPDDLRGRKVDLLRAVRKLSPPEVDALTVRARYLAGTVNGRPLPNYVDEEGVDGSRGTETFTEVTLFVDNWRWAGVPFHLRTGKALGHGRREIAVIFRPVPHLAFADAGHARANVFRLTLDPDTMSILININGPGDFLSLEAEELVSQLGPHELPAYARLLCEVLQRDMTLAIRDDEATEAWRIVEPILRAWDDGHSPLLEYEAGSDGPHVPGKTRSGSS
jgi:glucose-6-phosphate 1-dehydrogenase